MLELLKQTAIPRAVGTDGNNAITRLMENYLRGCGYFIKSMPFSCKVWNTGDSWIEWKDNKQTMNASPYTEGFHGEGIVQVTETLEELRKTVCENAILFLTGELAKEPIQPKNYPFYFPEEHKIILDLLEEKKPLAVIAVTGKHPMCGLNPYPLFEDGNFQIPSAYLSVDDFQKIKEGIIGKSMKVNIVSDCKETKSRQIYASKIAENAKGKIVICAHMDSKNHTQGTLDNATGIVTMLKTAERLQLKNFNIDIVPFNSEEYYGANGELLYLEEIKKNKEDIKLLVNIDSVGHVGSKVEASLYHIPETWKTQIKNMINKGENVQLGEEWYAGDHVPFSFLGIPCIAITSSDIWKGGLDHTHTMEDTIQTVDETLLVDAVSFIEELLLELKM